MPRQKRKSQPAAKPLHKNSDGSPIIATSTKNSPKQPQPEAVGDDQLAPILLSENKSAGLQLLVHRRFKQVQIRFTGSTAVSFGAALERNFWKFRPDEGVYTKQWGTGGEVAATESARRFFEELCRRLEISGGKQKSR